MGLQMSSQSISKTDKRVQTLVTINGDTLIQFKLSDARLLLNDLLDKKITDSLLTVYEKKDNLQIEYIELQVSQIKFLQEKSNNQTQQLQNLNLIVNNKNTETEILNDVIKNQKKEIRKQKTLKFLGIAGGVVLAIITVLTI
jgi:hypothetical protein